jgi:hypothetical protein
LQRECGRTDAKLAGFVQAGGSGRAKVIALGTVELGKIEDWRA